MVSCGCKRVCQVSNRKVESRIGNTTQMMEIQYLTKKQIVQTSKVNLHVMHGSLVLGKSICTSEARGGFLAQDALVRLPCCSIATMS